MVEPLPNFQVGRRWWLPVALLPPPSSTTDGVTRSSSVSSGDVDLGSKELLPLPQAPQVAWIWGQGHGGIDPRLGGLHPRRCARSSTPTTDVLQWAVDLHGGKASMDAATTRRVVGAYAEHDSPSGRARGPDLGPLGFSFFVFYLINRGEHLTASQKVISTVTFAPRCHLD